MLNITAHRREFLKGTGALVVCFSIAGLPPAVAQGTAAKTVSPEEVDGFLRIDQSGAVTLYSRKSSISVPVSGRP